jgi:hypothetical protein
MRLGTSPQKSLAALARAFKAMIIHQRIPEDRGSPPTEETQKTFDEMMDKIIRRAEERSGLDLDQEIDRKVFILAAATILYGPNDVGAKVK